MLTKELASQLSIAKMFPKQCLGICLILPILSRKCLQQFISIRSCSAIIPHFSASSAIILPPVGGLRGSPHRLMP